MKTFTKDDVYGWSAPELWAELRAVLTNEELQQVRISDDRVIVPNTGISTVEAHCTETNQVSLYDTRDAMEKLAHSDSRDMPRIVEDLIDILVANGIITMEDFPQEVLDKLNDRKLKREKIKK